MSSHRCARYLNSVPTGIFSLGLMAILGVTSLPGVSSSMSWAEFNFVQSRLGWASLIFAVLHIVFMEWDRILMADFECVVIPHPVQVNTIMLESVILSYVTVFISRNSKIMRIYIYWIVRKVRTKIEEWKTNLFAIQ